MNFPDVTGLWTVTDPDDHSFFYRFRQAASGHVEGLELGVGPISEGQLRPCGQIEWTRGKRHFMGQLDPTGWYIRDGSYSEAHAGEMKGRFAALRQRSQGDDGEDISDPDPFQDWAAGLFFSLDRDAKEQLLDADGAQVMMEWEKPYMETCVDKLCIDAQCDVLEVGFGCGYSANRIQEFTPRSHIIIECAPTVLERLHIWAANKPNVRIVEGTWQRLLPSLGRFDRIFFDDYGEPGRSDTEMKLNCPDERYRQAYSDSRSHFHGFLNIALRWHSREGALISGYLISPVEVRRRDVEVDYQHMAIKAPSHCNYFFADHLIVPRFTKTSSKKRSRDMEVISNGSTRSYSRSRSRSRSISPADSSSCESL